MSDINLLPENLRQEEEKELAAHKYPSVAPVYHLPNYGKEKLASQPATPSLDSVKDVQKLLVNKRVESGEVIKTLPKFPAPKVKDRKAVSLWNKLFKKKEKIITQPKEPASTLSPQPLKDIKDKVTSNQKETASAQPLKPPSLPVKPKSTIFGKEIDVNLLPEGINLLPSKKLKFYFGLTAIICLVLVGLGYLGVTLYNQLLDKQLQGIDQQLEAAEISYAKLKAKEEEASKWSKRVVVISSLLNNHVYLTKFFQYLEKTTIPDVYYTSISLSSDGVVTLTGQATNYTTVARQYQVFLNNSEIFPEVTLGGFSGSDQGGGGVGFNVQLKLASKTYYSLETQK